MFYWRYVVLCFLQRGEHPDLHRLHLYSQTTAGPGRIIGFFSMLPWRWRWATLTERGQWVWRRDHGLALLPLLSARTHTRVVNKHLRFVFAKGAMTVLLWLQIQLGAFGSLFYTPIFRKWITAMCSVWRASLYTPELICYNKKNNKNLVEDQQDKADTTNILLIMEWPWGHLDAK